MTELKGLIFDVDGTLVDSAPDLRNALNQMMRDHKRRDLTLEEVKEMAGDGMLTLIQRVLAATGGAPPNSDMDFFREFLGSYRTQKADPAQIYPYVRETLDYFFKAGIKLGVCTNKQGDATHRLLKDLDLSHYFEFVAGGDTFQMHKPHRDHLDGVITALDVPTANCVMVGDGRNDVAVAHNVKIPCIIVTLGYGVDFNALEADKLISSFKELPEALKELGYTFP